jgi:hypothetical protein
MRGQRTANFKRYQYLTKIATPDLRDSHRAALRNGLPARDGLRGSEVEQVRVTDPHPRGIA